MKLGIVFKCNKAAHICDKSQYAESTLAERLFMRMHQWMCSICRDHSNENSKLTETLHKADIQLYPQEKKEILRQRIQQEIWK